MRSILLALTLTSLFFITACSSSSEKPAAATEAKPAAVTAVVAKSTTTCTKKKDVRTLEVKESQDKKSCDLLYTKNSETKTAASSRHGKAHCEKVSKQITENLTSAGFECK